MNRNVQIKTLLLLSITGLFFGGSINAAFGGNNPVVFNDYVSQTWSKKEGLMDTTVSKIVRPRKMGISGWQPSGGLFALTGWILKPSTV